MTDSAVLPATGFTATGLDPVILAALTKLGFVEPTPIQRESIPLVLKGHDLIGIAQTGTGKTLAFGLPLIERLQTRAGKGLIVVPTRELAIQVEENLRKVTRALNGNLFTVCLIGGAPIWRQINDLKRKPRLVIATPGRLIDHLNQGTINLSDVCELVLDEADRMLDMGFAPQIKRILENVPRERQTLLFSATMPEEIATIARTYMHDPVSVEIARAGTTNELIEQQLCYVSKEGKTELLEELLKEHPGTVLVFSRTKHGASKLTRQLINNGHKAAEIHANRSLSQRRQALDGFKNGRYRILVATDIAARGIDVQGIGLVVNYDLPDASEDYVHRIGRTGRAGMKGHAISFATHDQIKDVRAIERLMSLQLPLHASSDAQPADMGRGGRDGRSGGRDGRSGRPFGQRPQGERRSYESRDSRPRREGDRNGGPREHGGYRGERSGNGGSRGGGRNRRQQAPSYASFNTAPTQSGFFIKRSEPRD